MSVCSIALLLSDKLVERDLHLISEVDNKNKSYAFRLVLHLMH